MIRVLYIDNDEARRQKVTLAMVSLLGPQIIALAQATQEQVESAAYDWIFVHIRNGPEATALYKNEWHRGTAKLVLFSGQYSKDHYAKLSEDTFRVPAQYLVDDFSGLWKRLKTS